MGRDIFYITTAIAYVNDVPHIGHAYEGVATDFVARYHRQRGETVFHLTGLDEHGLKIQRAAEANGASPKDWADSMAPRWREVLGRLDIANDDFIRTTEPRHEAVVKKLLRAVKDNGTDDIYLGSYEGLYCVSCEAYYTEDDLKNRLCPVHETPVEVVKEENYFFKLSAYADRLSAHYEANPAAIAPDTRRNEVLSVIRGGLQDFSISRTSFDWGVPLPWDETHVCYVWFDALANYITAAGYGDDPERFARMWPANIHMIGKDILRFHAIYWPAMLMAAGLQPPTQVWAHGFVNVGGKKMSKANATSIHPFELLDKFGVDSYRYYFMREIRFGEDGNFSWESMVDRHNADLANGLGNLASRVLAMLASYFDGVVPEPKVEGAESDLPEVTADALSRYDEHMLAVQLQPALSAVWDIVARANAYLVEKEPWKLAKDPAHRDELAGVLYASAETLRILAVAIHPIMPAAAGSLWSQLGQSGAVADAHLPAAGVWGGLASGTATTKGESLFPRVEHDGP
ncbi:MAG: methionyl-tRNA synthetase [Actinomycetota bacterium]|jgi:methionyl-tRNA synthetase|nr:methionyl-tRNA synthetase [Actinomycetota bacterium]